MTRKIWTGSIKFGLVTIPICLYNATEEHTISFHQYERGTSDRVRYKRINERTGEEVDYNDVVKGREVGDTLVTVEQKELDEIAPDRSHTIDIDAFVDLDEIDPVFFQRTYWLAPDNKEYYRPYNMLRDALNETNQVGIATFVLRGKAYLTAIRAEKNALALTTLFFADEIRDPREIIDDMPGTAKPSSKEMRMATTVIESMSGEWEPEEYRDTYTARVEQLIEDKSRGRSTEAAKEPPKPTSILDLSEALSRSVDRAVQQQKAKPVGTKRNRREADVHDLNKADLEKKAKELGIRGRSKMNRAELEHAVAEAMAEAGRGRRTRRAS